MDSLRQLLPDLLPAGLTLVAVVLVVVGVHLLLERRWGAEPGSR